MLAVSDLLTVCGWPMRWLFVGVASCYEKRNASLVFVVLILMRLNSASHRLGASSSYTIPRSKELLSTSYVQKIPTK